MHNHFYEGHLYEHRWWIVVQSIPCRHACDYYSERLCKSPSLMVPFGTGRLRRQDLSQASDVQSPCRLHESLIHRCTSIACIIPMLTSSKGNWQALSFCFRCYGLESSELWLRARPQAGTPVLDGLTYMPLRELGALRFTHIEELGADILEFFMLRLVFDEDDHRNCKTLSFRFTAYSMQRTTMTYTLIFGFVYSSQFVPSLSLSSTGIPMDLICYMQDCQHSGTGEEACKT